MNSEPDLVNDLLQEEVQRYRGQFQTMSGKL